MPTLEGLTAAETLTNQTVNDMLDQNQKIQDRKNAEKASDQYKAGDKQGAYATLMRSPKFAASNGPDYKSMNIGDISKQQKTGELGAETNYQSNPYQLGEQKGQYGVQEAQIKANAMKDKADDKIGWIADPITKDKLQTKGGQLTGKIVRDNQLMDANPNSYNLPGQGYNQPQPDQAAPPTNTQVPGAIANPPPSGGMGKGGMDQQDQQGGQTFPDAKPINSIGGPSNTVSPNPGAGTQNNPPLPQATHNLLQDEAVDSMGQVQRLNPGQMGQIIKAIPQWNKDSKPMTDAINQTAGSEDFLNKNIPGGQIIEKIKTIKGVYGGGRVPKELIDKYGGGTEAGYYNFLDNAATQAAGDGLSPQVRQNMYQINNSVQADALKQYDALLKNRVDQLKGVTGVDPYILKQKLGSVGPTAVQQHLANIQSLPSSAQALYNWAHDHELDSNQVTQQKAKGYMQAIHDKYGF